MQSLGSKLEAAADWVVRLIEGNIHQRVLAFCLIGAALFLVATGLQWACIALQGSWWGLGVTIVGGLYFVSWCVSAFD